MTIYTNLFPIHDSCDDYIPEKEGRYIITGTTKDAFYIVVNIYNGADALIAKSYFEKEFKAI